MSWQMHQLQLQHASHGSAYPRLCASCVQAARRSHGACRQPRVLCQLTYRTHHDAPFHVKRAPQAPPLRMALAGPGRVPSGYKFGMAVTRTNPKPCSKPFLVSIGSAVSRVIIKGTWQQQHHPDTGRPHALCRDEAQKDAMSEPLLSSFLFSSVLAHDR